MNPCVLCFETCLTREVQSIKLYHWCESQFMSPFVKGHLKKMRNNWSFRWFNLSGQAKMRLLLPLELPGVIINAHWFFWSTSRRFTLSVLELWSVISQCSPCVSSSLSSLHCSPVCFSLSLMFVCVCVCVCVLAWVWFPLLAQLVSHILLQ